MPPYSLWPRRTLGPFTSSKVLGSTRPLARRQWTCETSPSLEPCDCCCWGMASGRPIKLARRTSAGVPPIGSRVSRSRHWPEIRCAPPTRNVHGKSWSCRLVPSTWDSTLVPPRGRDSGLLWPLASHMLGGRCQARLCQSWPNCLLYCAKYAKHHSTTWATTPHLSFCEKLRSDKRRVCCGNTCVTVRKPSCFVKTSCA